MDTWDDKTTGEKRSKVKVQAERVQFLDRRRRRRRRDAADDDSAPPRPARCRRRAARPGGAGPAGRAARPTDRPAATRTPTRRADGPVDAGGPPAEPDAETRTDDIPF